MLSCYGAFRAVWVQTWVQDWIIDSALAMAIIRAMPAANSAPSTPPPDHAIARIDSYESLLAACRARVAQLGINYQILDIAAGFGDGYSTKLLAHSEYSATGGRRSKRHFSPESFDAYMSALGLELVAVENPDKVAKLKAFCESKYLAREGPIRTVASDCLINLKVSRNFLRQIGKSGGLARARKAAAVASAKKRISETNRRNALKRWRRQETTSDPPAEPGPSDRPPA